MTATRAAVGFKLHTGWAAVVAVSTVSDRIRILLRRRIELLPQDAAVPRFIYHEAAEMPLGDAAKLVKRAARASRETAEGAVAAILEELRANQVTVGVAGIVTGSTTLPEDLSAILASHALIHAAEGVLFQEALAAGCEAHGLTVSRTRERDLWAKLGSERHEELNGLRSLIGPPWGADQKVAAAAALLVANARH